MLFLGLRAERTGEPMSEEEEDPWFDMFLPTVLIILGIAWVLYLVYGPL